MEQLTKMGAKPVVSAPPSGGGGLTLDQLTKMGAAPIGTPAPVAPALTPDQEAGKATGAFFPANTAATGAGGVAKEAAKVLPNMIPSAFNFVKGAVDFMNPVSTVKKLYDVGAEIGGLNNQNKEIDKTNAATADAQNKLIETWKQQKAEGKDTSHLDAYFKNNGIDTSKIVTPAPRPGAFGQVAAAVPKAAYETLVPEAGRALVTAAHGAITGNDEEIDTGLATAHRDIVNDPVGSIAPFILGVKGGAEALDRLGVTKKASAAVDTGIGNMGRAGIKAVDVITKPVQYAFGKVAEGAGKVGEGIKTGAKFMGRQAAGFGNGTASRFMENTDLKPVANADELIAKRTDLGGQVQEALATKKAALGVTPESLGQEVQSALAKRSEALKETGPVYDAIRKNGENVQVEKNWIDQQIKSATGVDIKNGKITTSGAAKIRDAADVRALQHLYDTWKPVFNRGTMTSNEFLNFRSDAAGLANFERQIGKSQPIENAMKGVRANFNNSYRPQMESLASLDEITSPLYEEIKTLSKGLVDRNGNLSDSGLAKVVKATTDKPQLLAQLEKVSPGITEKIAALQEFNELGKGIIDEEGNITDAGMRKITNAANESNPQMLARLEQIKPGITGLIKDFKALQDVENARGSKVGTYTRSAIGGGGLVAGLMTMNPVMVGGAIAEMILTSPENAVKIIQTYAKTKPIMDAIVSKLKSGVKGTLNDINNITENPTRSLSNLRARLPEKIPMGASIEDVSGGKPGYSNLPKKGAFGPKAQGEVETPKTTFNKENFFQKQVFKYKTHDNYMENKYVGFAKASGLDRLGLGDQTIKWIDDWLGAKPTTPPTEATQQLSQYKPKVKTTIYSGNSIDQLKVNRTEPTSFTSDLEIAKTFGDAGRRDNPAIIKIENVDPSDVVVSMDMIPKNIIKTVASDKGFIESESEIVVNKSINELAKKYNVSISKDGGESWSLLKSKKSNFGK